MISVRAKTAEEILAEQIKTAKLYLTSTDFKMTVDYFATMTLEQQTSLTASRAEARAFLVANGY